MQVEININDYLNEAEIKEIVLDEFRERIKDQLKRYGNIDVLFANIGYNTFIEAGSKVIGLTENEIQDKIVQHLTSLFNDDKIYRLQVFRRKDAYTCAEDGIDTKILDDVLSKSRPIIERKVNELIEKYKFPELKEEICDTIYECIERKIFGSKEN